VTIEQRLRDRIWALIQEGSHLSHHPYSDAAIDEQKRADCSGWMTSAQNAVHIACPNPDSVYRQKADRLADQGWGYMIHTGVQEMAAVLLNLCRDADAGALATVADQARAETFDDFLDHADLYVTDGRQREAGTIAGVVFEDSLRRVCRKHGIADRDVSLDTLINALKSKTLLSGIEGKRAVVAAGVRTKATHAQWDEFTMNDVVATITFTRELISNHLDGGSPP